MLGLLLATLVAAHVALLWLVIGRHLDFLFNDAQHRMGPASDFVSYFFAGWHSIHGESPYGPGPGFGFRYHPLFAELIGRTLTHLATPWAYGVWVTVHEVLLVVDVVVLRRLLPDPRRFLIAAVVLTLFTPYYVEAYMGNATFVASSLLLVGFALGEAGRHGWARLMFAVSVIVKPLGLVFVPLLLMRRRWWDAVAVSVVPAVLALPFFLARPSEAQAFLHANLGGRDPGWVVHAGNQGLHGLLATLLTRANGVDISRLASLAELPSGARAALLALPLLLVLVAARATWRTRDRVGVGVFLWSAVYLLGFHDVWEHSYSTLVLGLGCLAAARFLPDRLLLWCAIAIACPTAFALYDVAVPPEAMDPEPYWSLGVSLLHHATKPLGVVILFVACAWKAEKVGRRPSLAVVPHRT